MTFEGFRIETDLDEFDEATEEAVHKMLMDVAIELGNQLQIEAPVGATGDLQRSFQILSEEQGEVIVGSRLPYAKAVQEGTDPHKPDFEGLKVWARRKLGNEDLAGPVFQTIKQEGTDANPYMDRAIENTLKRF